MISRLAALLLFLHLTACTYVGAAPPQAAPPTATASQDDQKLANDSNPFNILNIGKKKPEAEKITDGKARMVELGDFTPEVTGPFLNKVKELDSQGLPEIWVKINSNGGGIYAGLDLIQQMETLKTPVTCVVDFRAISMGFAFLQSGACDKRLMTKRSHLMAHEASAGGRGTADQQRDLAQALDSVTSSLVAMMADRMKMSEEDFWKKIRNREWYMDYHEAEKYKAIDGISDPKDFPAQVSYEIESPMFFIFVP